MSDSTEQVDLRVIQVLKWPIDKDILASLDLIELQCWWAGQGHREMVFLGHDPEFRRFWNKVYMRPLHRKRFWFKIRKFFHV